MSDRATGPRLIWLKPVRAPAPHDVPMDTLYLLIPLSLVAMFGVLGVFAWALYGGQFEELDAEGNRILFDPDQTGH